MENELFGSGMFGIGGAEGGIGKELPVDFATGVAAGFVADVAEVFGDVERDRLLLEVFDLVLEDDIVIPQIAGDVLHVVPFLGAFDDDILSHAEKESHFVIFRREFAPIFAEERGGCLGIFAGAFDEDASFTVRQGGLAEAVGGIVC